MPFQQIIVGTAAVPTTIAGTKISWMAVPTTLVGTAVSTTLVGTAVPTINDCGKKNFF